MYHTAWIVSGLLFVGGFVLGGELGSPGIFVIGEVGAVLAFVYAMYLSLSVIRNGDRRLLKRGIRGTATVLQAHRTNTVMQAGEFEWMAPWVWRYHLQVTIPNVEPYETVVSICAEVAEGQQVDIVAAPHNHKRVTIDVGQGGKRKDWRSAAGTPTAGTPTAGMPTSSGSLKFSLPSSASVPGDSAPDDSRVDDSRADDSISKLERLANLHERGVLTDDELAAEKRKVLGDV
jgi:hypothetical protein